jgi:menaquinone-9 beta-reductase
LNQKETYDAAIIGGGLAGLTLAIQLQQMGLKTILFEKEHYPFHRVCGEYISMESWDFLERLGIPLSALNLPRITQLVVSSPNGRSIRHNLQPGGFGISRFALDHHLCLLAKQTGVTVMENCLVQDVNLHSIHTSQGMFTAKIVLGAWGKRSRMDASLVRHFLQPQNRRLNDYVAVKYHVKANIPHNTIELHNFRNGYCGISKVDDERYCLCYLVKGSELKKYNGNIAAMEQQVLFQNPILKKYFLDFPSLYEKPLAIAQISFEPKSLREQQILMAGDAAGLITPLCGNGMSMAMHASYLLAQQVKNYADGHQSWDETVDLYSLEWNKHFAQRLKAGRFIQSLFGNQHLTNYTLAILKPFPSIINALVKATHGKPF